MNRLLVMLLLSLTLSGCAEIHPPNLPYAHPANITKYDTLIIKDFVIDELAYPGKDTDYQEKIYPIYLNAARVLSEDIGRVVLTKKFFDTVNINRDFDDNAAIYLEGKFLWVGKHVVSVQARLVDGLTGEIVVEFQHEEWDYRGTSDILRKMAVHIGMFIGLMRCAELPSFPFCPVH